MTAPAYGTDLQTITEAQAGTWGEITGYTGGGTPAVNDTDFFIQGTGCTSQSTGTKSGLNASMYFDYASDLAGSITAGMCVFFWQVLLAGNAMDTFANGGLRAGFGSGVGDLKMYRTGGNASGRNPYGGWQNVAIDPRVTADYPIGSPGSAIRYFGSMPNLLVVISKGNLHALDAIRYGRGQIKAEYGATADGYATFAGMAAKNDQNEASNYNRWGLFQAIPGGYLWKGLMSIGTATNATDFRDSNRNISIDDTPKAYTAFNRIEINHASSRVDWTSVQIAALGTLSKGEFEAMANADINFDKCVFTDMSTFVFQAASTILNTVFRRCGQITQGGGTFTGCQIEGSTAAIALVVSDIGVVTDTTFTSAGTGHGVQGFATAGTYDLSSLIFTGYAAGDGSTGNEAIYVTATEGTVTLTLGANYSVRSAGATIVKDINQVTLTISPIVTGSDVVIYDSSDGSIIKSSQNIAGTSYGYSYDAGDAGSLIDIGLFKEGYTPYYIRNYELGDASATAPASQQVDRFYIA